MKRFLILTIVVLGGTLLPPHALVAQTYYDFAFAEATNNYNKGLIRAVDPSTAVSYYMNSNGEHVIALLTLYGTMNEVILDPDIHSVLDLRVTGDYVFFCGRKGGNGFIGCIQLSTMISPTPTVSYTTPDPGYVESFHSMVAYKDGSNEKVVAVGEYHWPYNTTPFYGACLDTFHLCIRRPIAEFFFSGGTCYGMNLWTSDDASHLECANEVIETPTHVAIICYYTDIHAISIHYCDKGNVWGTFNNYYYYPAPDEGHSHMHGCYMYNEVIALSSLSTYFDAAGQEQFTTKIRVIDLATMTNLYAQHMPLYTKSEPLELLYVPDGEFLALLQDAVDPATLLPHNYFTNILYTAPAPYITKCWYESYYTRYYQSADMLTPSHLIAPGTKSFLMQKMTSLMSGTCYTVDTRPILPLNIEELRPGNYSYPTYPPFPQTLTPPTRTALGSMTLRCSVP